MGKHLNTYNLTIHQARTDIAVFLFRMETYHLECAYIHVSIAFLTHTNRIKADLHNSTLHKKLVQSPFRQLGQ